MEMVNVAVPEAAPRGLMVKVRLVVFVPSVTTNPADSTTFVLLEVAVMVRLDSTLSTSLTTAMSAADFPTTVFTLLVDKVISGASLTAVMFTVRTTGIDSPTPSLAMTVTVTVPLSLALGWMTKTRFSPSPVTRRSLGTLVVSLEVTLKVIADNAVSLSCSFNGTLTTVSSVAEMTVFVTDRSGVVKTFSVQDRMEPELNDWSSAAKRSQDPLGFPPLKAAKRVSNGATGPPGYKSVPLMSPARSTTSVGL